MSERRESEDPWMKLDRGELAVLVAASARRRNGSAPREAWRMHASRVFRLAYGYAEMVSDWVWILSPRHGLLDPLERIEPYRATFGEMTLQRLVDWADRVVERLDDELPRRVRRVLVLAPGNVARAVAGALAPMAYCPLVGLKHSEVVRWLEERLPRCSVCGRVVERPASDYHASRGREGRWAHRACLERRVLDCWVTPEEMKKRRGCRA